MSRRVGCPFEKWADAWIELPDEWLGLHIERRDEAVKSAIEQDFNATLTQFSVAIALLENWGNVPGLEGNPDQWDFKMMKVEIISWIIDEVLNDFSKCFEIPKVLSSPSGSQPMEMERTKQPGSSTESN